MSDLRTVRVPDVIGRPRPDAELKLQKAGLVIAPVTFAKTNSVPKGSVIASDPPADTAVDAGTHVVLQISLGPSTAAVVAQLAAVPAVAGLSGQNDVPVADASRNAGSATGEATGVVVPDVVGLTQEAAERTLDRLNLAVGKIKHLNDQFFPSSGVSATSPRRGTVVPLGTPVDLDISVGPMPERRRALLPPILFGLLGVLIIGLIAWGIAKSDFLASVADAAVARGLITFLIAFTTVGIAILLAVSTLLLGQGEDGAQRFDHGKQLFTALIGVLGTIVGFYFGKEVASGQAPVAAQRPAAVITAELPSGIVNRPYMASLSQPPGLTGAVKWSVKPELPPGMVIDLATGTITGTPTAALQKSDYVFSITDSAQPPVTVSRSLSLEVRKE